MSANRANIGWHLAEMLGDQAAAAGAITMYKAEDGILECMGLTVPVDATADYAPGCIFHHVDGEVVATGTVDSGDATSLLDATLTATFDSDDELIGMYVVDTNKEMYGLIDDYAQSTGDITVDDWLDYDGVAVAAATIPVADDDFIVFKQTSGDTLYVNCGNDITGCRFERVLTAGMNEAPLIDNQDSPSQAIWGGIDLNALRNFSGGFLFEDDFMGEIDVTSADGWVITQEASGVILGEVDAPGGVLTVSCGGHNAAHDGVNVQLPNCSVLPAAGQKIYFEARVKMKNTGLDEYFIGLCAANTDIIEQTTGLVDDTTDKVGFFRDEGASPADDRLTTITARTTAEAEGADKVVCADDTWLKLGFVIDGLTSINFYANGELVDTVPVAETANIPNAGISLSFVAQVDSGHADNGILSVDWVRVAQVGVRDA
jgi:hypothetical protein